MTRGHSQDLFEQVGAISISRYISYATCKLPKKAMINKFPEAAKLNSLFHPRAIHEWREMMQNHNRNINRGERMMLLPYCRSLRRFRFDSLDIYMLTMHGDAYVQALLSIASFGAKVQKAREANQDYYADGGWFIEMPFMIMPARWTVLCKRVKKLIKGIEAVLKRHDIGPHVDSLRHALHEVSQIF